jgi:hypothetical protein
MCGVGNDFLDIIKYIMRLRERQTGPQSLVRHQLMKIASFK